MWCQNEFEKRTSCGFTQKWRNYERYQTFSKILFIYCIVRNVSEVKAFPSTTTERSTSNGSTIEIEYFHWEDYSVLAAMLLISCAIGVFYGYFGESQTTSDDFLLGGSSMGTFPMALSLAASFVTAIELLGNPAEMYVSGAQFWMICIAFVLVVPITSNFYLPVFMRLRLTSCYEYLEVRFCKTARVFASALYMLQMVFYTAVAVYAPALALSDVTGLNTYVAVSLVYVVCIFYASQGGMKAVIMTDTFQSAVLIGSLAAVLFVGAEQTGGYNFIWKHVKDTERLNVFQMDPDPTVRHSFWSVVFGGTLYWTSMFCANQASVQKYLSVERLSQARIALWVSAIGLIAVYTVNFMTGAVLAAYYADCDPITAKIISASDRVLPLYVVSELGHLRGMPGFFVAGIFAASLGTVASALNSLAAIACQDLATGLLRITIPEDKGALIARWVCLTCGAVSFALVFAVERMGSVLQLALSFNGIAGGVSLGLFSLGMLFPWANSKGAVSGGIVGLLVVIAVGGGAQLWPIHQETVHINTNGCLEMFNTTVTPEIVHEDHQEVFWLFRVSYLWYSGLGCVITFLVGVVISLATGPEDPADIPVDLLSPPIVKLLNSLPGFMKKRMNISQRLGAERRRSSSVKPASLVDDKDTRRRRRLSEMAGGVFYTDNLLIHGYDNIAMHPEKVPNL